MPPQQVEGLLDVVDDNLSFVAHADYVCGFIKNLNTGLSISLNLNRSFPRKRESRFLFLPGPRFRGGERKRRCAIKLFTYEVKLLWLKILP
jgi:hypothetical protein